MEVYQTSRYILWLPELLGLIKTSGQSTEEKDVQTAKIGTVFIPGFTELYLGILTGIGLR